MATLNTLTHALQTAGLRLTPQRLAICRLLVASADHPTAQAIYNDLRPEFPSLSLATVYNTLETLLKLGAINSLGTAGDDAVHFDADTQPHVNLACTVCHRVIDLPNDHVADIEQEVAATSGYQIFGARVLYYGVCPDCQAETTRLMS